MRQPESVSPTDSASRTDTDSAGHTDSDRAVEALVGPPPKKTDFRDDIEGLRGFTLLAIVGWHISMPGVSGGFVGPDIFFEISGFVITGQLWKQVSNTGTVGLRKFYGARSRRLLPVSATVGVITAIAAALLLPAVAAQGALKDAIACALYVPNFWFIVQQVDYFSGGTPSPFQHYWTLGVEEQFYLLWPPMIVGTAWLIRRLHRRRKTDAPPANKPSKTPYLVLVTLIALISFALSLLVTYVMPLAAYFSLFTRAWQLALGALVALTAEYWSRLPERAAVLIGWLGLAMVLWACVTYTPDIPYPGTAALLPVLGTALLLGAGCSISTRGAGRILGWSPMRVVGRLSYSWYLWHWPVLVFAPIIIGHPLGLFGKFMAAVVVSGGLGWLTLRFIENPLRYAAPLRKSPGKSLAAGGLATALAACVGVALLMWVSSIPMPVAVAHGAQAKALTITAPPTPTGDDVAAYDAAVQNVFAQVQAGVAASADLRDVPSNLDPSLAGASGELGAMMFDGCLRLPVQAGTPECATGDVAAKTTVAVIGDSHASMWIPAFQQIGTQRPWRIETMAKAACPMMDLPIANRFAAPLLEYLQHCEQWRGQVMARLRAEHPKLVVLSVFRGYMAKNSNGFLSGFTSYDPAWIGGLKGLVQQLRGIGAKVLVLGPLPRLTAAVPACLSEHLTDATACSPPMSFAFDRAGIAAEAAAVKAGGGQYAELEELFCTKNRCPVIIGNTLVYVDAGHLTLEYSRLISPAIAALADRALAQN
ncbi:MULTISPECIES: acyltransferase family protein [Mycobacterium]|uniref:acyltransferase family protein n=1 Tax=Mycobacterium TaxID=1763 RepID=UPI001EF0CB60|nr:MULTISPECIES: acyltransferase family protein [Mycobacterium]GLB94428.1 acyltransferase [Mycobacterium kiyosense]GLC00891.1 acyltransferase [Mycobacterium kiyosense]GLC20884.1 acyltransferase [Mycobacterium kiyosense]GLD18417.1 acyltransferase [Mycobacterium kiyosense]